MYGKVFAQLFDGTLHGRLEASAVFMAMIAIADSEGTVDLTLTALTSRTGWPADFIQRGIAELEADDPHSRTPTESGRRIIRLRDNTEWGWSIVNYAKYRDIRDESSRREYMREYMREYRGKQPVNSVNSGKQQLAHTDTDTDTDKETDTEALATSREVSRGVAERRKQRRCPEDFQLTPELRAIAAELPPDFDLDGETLKFRDHEFRTARSDWPATWRKWMRTARDDRRYAKRAASAATIKTAPTQDAMAAAKAEAARLNRAQIAKVMPRLA